MKRFERINDLIDDAVHKVFKQAQAEEGIEYGDISPGMNQKLEEKKALLISIIDQTISKQLEDKKNERTQGNELIAKFLGDEHHPAVKRYDAFWNYLMPVVEKIQKLKYHFILKQIGEERIIQINYIHGVFIIEKQGETLKETMWKAIVEFIKYYNYGK